MVAIITFLLTTDRAWLYWHQVATGWTALAFLWAALVFSWALLRISPSPVPTSSHELRAASTCFWLAVVACMLSPHTVRISVMKWSSRP